MYFLVHRVILVFSEEYLASNLLVGQDSSIGVDDGDGVNDGDGVDDVVDVNGIDNGEDYSLDRKHHPIFSLGTLIGGHLRVDENASMDLGSARGDFVIQNGRRR